MNEELKFKTVMVDGALFVFMMTERNLFLGVIEATRIDESQKDLYEVRHHFIKYKGKGYGEKLQQKFIEEIESNNIKLNIDYESIGNEESVY